MSGIEVAGLILGAIPILVEGLTTYKRGIKSIRIGFQRRKEVEKLCRVLEQQENELGELLKTILLHSGCDVPAGFPATKREVLKDPETQAAVRDYLGTSYDTFVGVLRGCDDTLQDLGLKIAKFVPGSNIPKELSKIREVNKASKSSQPDVVARLALVLSKKDFEQECRRLDTTMNSLQRLFSLITSNHQLVAEQPGRRAKRLARALWKIRSQADDIYSAVAKSWQTHCHHKHEAKLFLEDRLEQSRQIRARAQDKPIQAFQLVFTGIVIQGKDYWHESVIQIFDEPGQAVPDSPQATPVDTRTPKVSINIPAPPPIARSQAVKDICSAIEGARTSQQHATFALTKDCTIALDCVSGHQFTPFQARDALTLKALLSSASRTPNSRSIMSWSVKLSLALNVASSFLQLLRTPWSAPRLSTESVTLLESSDKTPNASKPLLSLSFDSAPPAQQAVRDQFILKDALIDLGIMLLEIWHETTLELRFALDPQKLNTLQRRIHAFEWLESDPGALPGAYQGAILHCLAGALNSTPAPKDWDDMRLWETMCENVIEPLEKFAKI